MTKDEIRVAILARVGKAFDELFSADPDMEEVRDKLCDAAQFTHFREDGTRTDQIEPPLMSSANGALYQSDIDVLSGSINRTVRCNEYEDLEVKRLYMIYDSL